MATPIPFLDLPSYIEQKDQGLYNEELNQTLRQWFNSSGFYQPTLTLIQVDQLIALYAANPTAISGYHWLNADLNKMQFIDITGVVQTITSA